MRVLLVGPNSIHLRRYWDFMTGAGIDMPVVTHRGTATDRDWFNDLPDDRRAYTRFSLRNPSAVFRNARVIRQRLLNWKCDLLHVHQANVFAIASLGAVRNSSIPLILTAYGSDIQVGPEQSAVLRYLVRRVLRAARSITSESRSLIDEIDRLAPGTRAKCRRIPFPLAAAEPPTYQRELLAYSNRLHEPNYRIDVVLRAMAVLHRVNGAGFRGVIAGTGSETDALRQLAGELGLGECVEFVGWVDSRRNAEYYDRARYFFSLPEKDAYSISLQEAMQHGCIPIVSDIPCNRELVIDGLNGVIFDRAEDLPHALAALDADRAVALNRDLIQQTTEPSHCIAQFVRLYRDAMGPS